MKIINIILFTILSNWALGQSIKPELLKFNASECLTDSTKNFEFDYKISNDSITKIYIKINANCCSADYHGLRTDFDTLTLVYGPNFIRDSLTNEIIEVEHCLCECYFKFEFIIKNLNRNYLVRLRNEGYNINLPIIGEIKKTSHNGEHP